MANHQVPTRAREVERMHGIDADGNVVVCVVYAHHRQGHKEFMYYVVQYREKLRRTERGSRVTRQFSGGVASSRERLERELAEVRALTAASVEAFRSTLFPGN